MISGPGPEELLETASSLISASLGDETLVLNLKETCFMDCMPVTYSFIIYAGILTL
jgi:hypothetical protein